MIELYETVEKNEYDYLRKLLIMRGVEKTLPQKRKNLLLQLSAELGHPCCCEILLKGSASVDCINDYKETPLHLSAWHGHFECCRLLLDNGASPNPKNSNGWTPLQTTVWRCNEKCIQVFLSNEKVDQRCLNGFGDFVMLSAVDEGVKQRVLKIIESLESDVFEKIVTFSDISESPDSVSFDHEELHDIDIPNPGLLPRLLPRYNLDLIVESLSDTSLT